MFNITDTTKFSYEAESSGQLSSPWRWVKRQFFNPETIIVSARRNNQRHDNLGFTRGAITRYAVIMDNTSGLRCNRKEATTHRQWYRKINPRTDAIIWNAGKDRVNLSENIEHSHNIAEHKENYHSEQNLSSDSRGVNVGEKKKRLYDKDIYEWET